MADMKSLREGSEASLPVLDRYIMYIISDIPYKIAKTKTAKI